jgi:hypothetical protein
MVAGSADGIADVGNEVSGEAITYSALWSDLGSSQSLPSAEGCTKTGGLRE